MTERITLYTLQIKGETRRIKKRLVDIDFGELRIPQGRGLIYLESREYKDKFIVSSTPAVSIKAEQREIERLKDGKVLKENDSLYHALDIQPLLEINNTSLFFSKLRAGILREVEVR